MEKILNYFCNTKYENYFTKIENVTLQGYLYKDLFKAFTKTGIVYAIKVRDLSKNHVQESIKYLSEMNDDENIISKNEDVLINDGKYICISKWIHGVQPIDTNRDKIQKFYSMLAKFNKNNLSNGPYTSMYLDGRKFFSIEELVITEFNECIAGYNGKHSKLNIQNSVKNICLGFGCLILEDMNTGNMIIDQNGSYHFIDTEYLTAGINLYQFDHVNLFNLDEIKWYNVTNEKDDVLNEYFKILCDDSRIIKMQILGFAMLKLLRKIAFLNWKKENVDYQYFDNKIDEILQS